MNDTEATTFPAEQARRTLAAVLGEADSASWDTLIASAGVLADTQDELRGERDIAVADLGRHLADARAARSAALHAGATDLTPLQHVAAALTVLAAELAEHPQVRVTLYTQLGVHGPEIDLSMSRADTTREERAALLADVARVTGAGVSAPNPYGIAVASTRDWRGSGISVYAQGVVADDTTEATSGE